MDYYYTPLGINGYRYTFTEEGYQILCPDGSILTDIGYIVYYLILSNRINLNDRSYFNPDTFILSFNAIQVQLIKSYEFEENGVITIYFEIPESKRKRVLIIQNIGKGYILKANES
jgi:hypothetical protein